MLSRESQLAMLSRPLDVLVIGGGITGAGVALDAVTRGYRVGLVEQADFASGTSSRSTKLIHGGIRYLARGELKLVAEALRERTRLLRLAPHQVRSLAYAQNRVSGARVEDRLTGRALDVRASHVVNATGVWAERVAAMDGAPPFRIRPSKGAHLVLRGQVLPSETAVVIPQTDD